MHYNWGFFGAIVKNNTRRTGRATNDESSPRTPRIRTIVYSYLVVASGCSEVSHRSYYSRQCFQQRQFDPENQTMHPFFRHPSQNYQFYSPQQQCATYSEVRNCQLLMCRWNRNLPHFLTQVKITKELFRSRSVSDSRASKTRRWRKLLVLI